MNKIDPTRFGKVAVIAGGGVAERDVSLESGQCVYEALKKQGIDVHFLDIKNGGLKAIAEDHFDRAFPLLHGTPGEDGTMQGLLELYQIPYVGAGVLSSAIAMNKVVSNKIWAQSGLPTLPSQVVSSVDEIKALGSSWMYPLCVKPAEAGGSSVGISKVTSPEECEQALNEAHKYDAVVMVQPWIEGREMTVSIVADEAYPIIEIKTPARQFYDYTAKYSDDSTVFICPCECDPELEKQLQTLALEAYRAIHCRHWGRVDFIVDKENNPWLLELNTIPGMTSHSLVPQAARAKGLDFEGLVVKILSQTLIN